MACVSTLPGTVSGTLLHTSTVTPLVANGHPPTLNHLIAAVVTNPDWIGIIKTGKHAPNYLPTTFGSALIAAVTVSGPSPT